MKLFTPVFPQSKKLAAPLLLVMAVWSGAASAEEFMADDEPTAPCGELRQIGDGGYIYNLSNYSYKVKFMTKATRKAFRHTNAGVVKYLKVDADGNGVWVDTGFGDYRSSKTYTVPVRGRQAVIIAYCADVSRGDPYIQGIVSFDPDPAEGPHPGPSGYVDFARDGFCISSYRNCFPEVQFNNNGVTPYVNYNKMPDTAFKKGSLTILPQ